MTPPEVTVIGGSLGGLTAGLVLRDAGCDVHIYERAARPLQSQGAGIVLHPATIRYLLERGDVALERIGAEARVLRYIDEDGNSVHEQPCAFRFSSYAWLYTELLSRFDDERYLLNAEATEFDVSADRGTVTFVDGTTRTSDLVVLADGIHSTGRQHFLPDVRPSYAGYVGWRGTVVESALSEETFRRTLDRAVSYHVMPNSHILTYPIPDHDGSLEPGRRLTNWVWYRNVPEGPQLDSLLTDRRGVRRDVSVGPGAVAEAHVRELRGAAERDLPGPLAEIVLETQAPFLQVVLDVEVPRMVFGRACIIGDAAFVARPHLAAGTAKAAEDAWQLGRAVEAASDIPTALANWEPPQLALGRRMLERAREAGRRSQFESTWQVGDPLPYGLYETGDSALPGDPTR